MQGLHGDTWEGQTKPRGYLQNAGNAGKKIQATGGISTLLSPEGHSFQRKKKYKLNSRAHGQTLLNRNTGVFGHAFDQRISCKC